MKAADFLSRLNLLAGDQPVYRRLFTDYIRQPYASPYRISRCHSADTRQGAFCIPKAP